MIKSMIVIIAIVAMMIVTPKSQILQMIINADNYHLRYLYYYFKCNYYNCHHCCHYYCHAFPDSDYSSFRSSSLCHSYYVLIDFFDPSSTIEND